jgi:large subunit ribosomal protein L22
MAQDKNKKQEQAGEAKAFGRYFQTSPQKLNLVAQTIRGKSAAKALVDLEFSKRRIAQDVRKLLASAVANAENNHGLDIDRLVVAEASVGKTMMLKRFHTRGRGRSAGIQKKVSNMTIVVREAAEG